MPEIGLLLLILVWVVAGAVRHVAFLFLVAADRFDSYFTDVDNRTGRTDVR